MFHISYSGVVLVWDSEILIEKLIILLSSLSETVALVNLTWNPVLLLGFVCLFGY